jgi:hypothetical protein
MAKRKRSAARYAASKRRAGTTKAAVRARARRGQGVVSRKVPFVLYNNLLQQSVMTRLTYCDTKTLDPGATYAYHTWRAHSIYDPDYSAVGHQPLYHDQWQALYENYRVLKAVLHVDFISAATAADQAGAYQTYVAGSDTYPFPTTQQGPRHRICCVEMSKDLTPQFATATDVNVLREGNGKDRLVKWRNLTQDKSSVSISMDANLREMLADQFYDSRHSFGTNPSQNAFMHIVVMSADGGAAYSVRCNIRIDYYVELSHPKDPGGS